MRTALLPARRRLIEALLGVAMLPLWTHRVRAHDLGPVEPAIAIPPLACVRSDGRSATLLELSKARPRPCS